MNLVLSGIGNTAMVGSLVAGLAAGCGGATDDAPDVESDAVVGNWRSLTTAENTLALRADGSYSHSITDFNTPDTFACTDSYRVDGSHVTLDHSCVDPDGACSRMVDLLPFAVSAERLSLAAFQREPDGADDVTGEWIHHERRSRSLSGSACSDADLMTSYAATLTLALHAAGHFRLDRSEEHWDDLAGELVVDESFVEGEYRLDGDEVILEGAPILPIARIGVDRLAPGEELFAREPTARGKAH